MKKSSFLKLIQCVVLCLLTITIVPEKIYAEEAVACMKDDSGKVIEYYYTIPDAMNGSRKGEIHMLTDWDLGAQINIVEGTTSIIYMDGYTIKKTNGKKSDNSEGGIFTLHPNAELYLYGSTEEKEFTDSKGNKLTSGGLVTGGYTNTGGAIYMKKTAKLYLTNVAISGNTSEGSGGGIFVSSEDGEIWMDNAHVDHNYSVNSGGGIYSDADGTHIHMENHSTINNNTVHKTGSSGGGVAFNNSWFSLEGDGTSEVSYNSAIPGDYGTGTSGGGIYVASKMFASNYGIISGITIKGNYAGQGGGIDAFPRNFYLKDVTITDNTSIIRGGGVFVLYDIDLYLSGDVKIYGNHRTDGADDDVFLQSAFGQAYVIASDLNSDSLIGIRTETTGDRLVAENISQELVSCFFLNETSKYHIGYQSNDRELWQRNGVTTYSVKVNGQAAGRYVEGTQNVTIMDTSSLFSSWQENSDVKLDSNQLKSNVISFIMPAKDVEFKANYISAATDISLKVSELTVNETFPSQADLVWTNDISACTKKVDITWYKNTENGYQKVMPSDTVEAGVAYMFTTTIEKKTEGNLRLAFSDDLKQEDVKIFYGNTEIDSASFSLNDEGTLSLSINSVVVGQDELSYVVPVVVSVEEGISKSDLINLINNNKQTKASSVNYKEYDVSIEDIGESNLKDDWFGDDGLKTNEDGYYRIDDISLEQNNYNITTSIIINVATKQTSRDNVYKLKDEYEQDETNWHITFNDIDGNYYSIRDVQGITQCNSSKCSYKLTGVKGQVKEYSVDIYKIDDYSLKPVISETREYILDDFKLNTPTFNDAIESSDGNNKSLTVSAYSNDEATIYYLYNDGTNKWNISKDNSITLNNSENAYKTYKVKSWASNGTSVSSVSDSSYVIDNLTNIVNVNKININVNWPNVGENLPTTISSIKAQLKGRTVEIASDLSITSWNHDKGGDTVKDNYLYQANIKLDSLDSTSIDLLKNYDVVIGDGTKKTYSYVDQQDGAYWLHIIFCGANYFSDEYNDKSLNYTLTSIEVGDYTKSLSYEKAIALNNDLSKLDLPYILLNVKNNNNDEQEVFRLDASNIFEFVSSFDSNNLNAQKIILKANIADLIPSYVMYDGIDTNITLTINVSGKDTNQNKVVNCEETMNSKNWTWSESKKACVYRVSNTSSK